MAGQPTNREYGPRGGTIDLDVIFYKDPISKSLVDDDGFSSLGTMPRVEIYDPNGLLLESGYGTRLSQGVYNYPHKPTLSAVLSDKYKIRWKITIYGVEKVFEELFIVLDPGDAVFNRTDCRIGFAFNNPNLTAGTHAPNWGWLVSPDELRDVRAFGNPLIASADGQLITDETLLWYAENAIGLLEREISTSILPRRIRHNPPRDADGKKIEVEQYPDDIEWENSLLPGQKERLLIREKGYEFRPQNNTDETYYLQLKERPLLEVRKCELYSTYGSYNHNFMQYMEESIGQDSHLNLFLHHFGFIPAMGGGGYYPIGHPGIPQERRNWLKIGVDYDVGFKNCSHVPHDLREVISKLAALALLSDFGDGKSAAIASGSASLGGISESFSTTLSATSAMFGARALQWQKELDKWLKENRQKYSRTSFI